LAGLLKVDATLQINRAVQTAGEFFPPLKILGFATLPLQSAHGLWDRRRVAERKSEKNSEMG
jgi:hypothetical protein